MRSILISYSIFGMQTFYLLHFARLLYCTVFCRLSSIRAGLANRTQGADDTMLQLSITLLPSDRALVSVFVPEHTVEGFQLGTLFEDLGRLEPFGCFGATITE